MKLKIEIKTIGGSILFSLEKENNTIKQTLQQAVKEGAHLRGAYLEGAYLRGAHLEGAHLRDAYLEGADLRGAHLKGADLRGAYLRGADLRGAHLRGAYLEGAYLEGAYLEGAHLRGAKENQIPKSYINQCSRDMLFIFNHLKVELPFLRERLVKGEVDGTCYEGKCACLIGSLANADGGLEKVVSCIPYYDKGLHNFGEMWFWNIRKGDTPENSFFAKHAVKLIDSILENTKVTSGIAGEKE